jgi:secreted trypsin-like serine protease
MFPTLRRRLAHSRALKRTTSLLAATLLALGAVAAAAPAGADGTTAKVTRSRNADPGEYPGQAALLFPEGGGDDFADQYCGGTLIHPEWVLTAAHCVVFEGDILLAPDVVLGTTRLDGSGEHLETDGRSRVHPQYSDASYPANDIAVLHLRTPATSPVARLAYDGLSALETPATPAIVTGWGGLSGDEQNQQFPIDLQEGDVPVISDDACDTALAAHGDDLPDAHEPTIVCAGTGTISSEPEEADACRGDSGGPLWASGPDGIRRQIGIVSGGPTCGRSPTYYTSVEAHIGFIETVTGLQLASFGDIPGDPHEGNVELVAFNAFASGLPGGTFQPSSIVSRGQMATFLARALGLAPVATGPFSDVAGTPHEQNINAVAEAGIAGGFADGTYKPTELVTRDQMATFLARALGLAPVAEGRFTDTAGNTHEQNINAVAQAGVAGGFPDGTYKPRNGVTRGQMATFLARAFLP